MPLQNRGLVKSFLVSYKLSLIILIILISQSVCANKNEGLINTTIQIDFRSMHVWRGIATSYVPSIEPSFEINQNNYKTGIWFAQSIDGNYTELDLYLTYNYKNFSFTIYDYYCPPSIEASSEIANYDRNSTKHTIELDLAYLGSQEFPLKVLVATMIYGDDLNTSTNKNQYSTYLEFNYSTEIDEQSLNIFIGLNPFKSYYSHKTGVINAGVTASRNVKLYRSLTIPFQASLITNPLSNSLFLSFGFTL